MMAPAAVGCKRLLDSRQRRSKELPATEARKADRRISKHARPHAREESPRLALVFQSTPVVSGVF